MNKFALSTISKEDIEGTIASGALLTSAILPHGEVDGLNLCPWFHLTGHQCPFCGMTRGFVAMTHFDFQAALDQPRNSTRLPRICLLRATFDNSEDYQGKGTPSSETCLQSLVIFIDCYLCGNGLGTCCKSPVVISGQYLT